MQSMKVMPDSKNTLLKYLFGENYTASSKFEFETKYDVTELNLNKLQEDVMSEGYELIERVNQSDCYFNVSTANIAVLAEDETLRIRQFFDDDGDFVGAELKYECPREPESNNREVIEKILGSPEDVDKAIGRILMEYTIQKIAHFFKQRCLYRKGDIMLELDIFGDDNPGNICNRVCLQHSVEVVSGIDESSRDAAKSMVAIGKAAFLDKGFAEKHFEPRTYFEIGVAKELS